MRGRKYNDEIKERAYALWAIHGNYQYVAEQLGLPESTVRTWIKRGDMEADGAITEARAKNKLEFARAAWEPINDAMELLKRQIRTALDDQDALDTILDYVDDQGEALNNRDRAAIVSKIRRMQRPDMRELTTAIGTLYDKQALAIGDPTANTAASIDVSNMTFEQLQALAGEE